MPKGTKKARVRRTAFVPRVVFTVAVVAVVPALVPTSCGGDTVVGVAAGGFMGVAAVAMTGFGGGGSNAGGGGGTAGATSAGGAGGTAGGGGGTAGGGGAGGFLGVAAVAMGGFGAVPSDLQRSIDTLDGPVAWSEPSKPAVRSRSRARSRSASTRRRG